MNANLLTNPFANSTFKSEREVTAMDKVSAVLQNIIPITLFNRGQASRIFKEVKEGAVKIVIKNNEPEAVLISPEKYAELADKAEDYDLIQMVYERMEDNGTGKSFEEVLADNGMTEQNLKGWEDIEIE